MESPLLLCIETSSPVCSVALGKGDVVCDEIISVEPNGHSKLLASMISDLLQRNNVQFEKLDAISLNAGPGSYTGLRIGMSTAKGLCYALEKPLIAITAFESMVNAFLAKHDPDEGDLLVPMIDARRMEVYTQLYNGKGLALAEQKAHISGEGNLFLFEPQGNIYLFGSGAEKMLAGFAGYPAKSFGESFISASTLVKIAYERWQNKAFDDVAYTTPNYGKDWQKA